MKKVILLSTMLLTLLAACNDSFMDRYPLDEVSPQTYFKTEGELETYINGLYEDIEPEADDIYNADNQSDNVATKSYNTIAVGQYQLPTTGGGWNWEYLRDVNFFLENYTRADIDEAVKQHYGGLGRFFRAWFYFDKLKRFGDVPWYNQTLSNTDTELLYKGRDSRVLISDSIMADLDYAAAYISEDHTVSTINRWTALALQARAALFEGTYRKYRELDDADVTLTKAYQAAETIMKSGEYTLYTTGAPTQDYQNLFIQDKANEDEYILARVYDDGLNVKHSANANFITGTLATPGLTRSLINTYLMADGSRFTDLAGYATMTFPEETKNRDPRLAQTIRTPGYTRVGGTTKLVPAFDNAVTGYQSIKYVMSSAYDGSGKNVNDMPVFRYAEVLLNYAEAKAELGQLTQADLDLSVNLLRRRVGMPDMRLASLSVDPFLQQQYPNVTGEQAAAILEIRRERRVELAMEGFRYHDLMRWHVGERLADPSVGMYVPGLGELDIDGDGAVDVAFVTQLPSKTKSIQYMVLGDGFTLEDNNEKGQIIMYPNLVKSFIDPKNYLFPIPRTELLLNTNLVQNSGWEE